MIVVTTAALALCAALVAGVVAVNGRGDRDRATAAESPSATPSGHGFPGGPDAAVGAGQTPGLVITGLPLRRGATLVKRDRRAHAGPSTVVLRRPDGSLGRHGAVVTYPVAPPSGGLAVRVGDVTGRAREREITWPAGGSYARVRGDLSRSALIAVADATAIVSGRPAVSPPPGLGLSVTATGTSRPPFLNETRYSSRETGETDELSGGLTFAGVARCDGLEDTLYTAPVRAAGTVHGRPAVVTSALGGNGALVWEPAPGVVAYVGYSGAQLDDGAVAALRRLAARTRLISPEQWRATDPATSDQTNDMGGSG